MPEIASNKQACKQTLPRRLSSSLSLSLLLLRVSEVVGFRSLESREKDFLVSKVVNGGDEEAQGHRPRPSSRIARCPHAALALASSLHVAFVRADAYANAAADDQSIDDRFDLQSEAEGAEDAGGEQAGAVGAGEVEGDGGGVGGGGSRAVGGSLRGGLLAAGGRAGGLGGLGGAGAGAAGGLGGAGRGGDGAAGGVFGRELGAALDRQAGVLGVPIPRVVGDALVPVLAADEAGQSLLVVGGVGRGAVGADAAVGQGVLWRSQRLAVRLMAERQRLPGRKCWSRSGHRRSEGRSVSGNGTSSDAPGRERCWHQWWGQCRSRWCRSGRGPGWRMPWRRGRRRSNACLRRRGFETWRWRSGGGAHRVSKMIVCVNRPAVRLDGLAPGWASAGAALLGQCVPGSRRRRRDDGVSMAEAWRLSGAVKMELCV